MQFLTTLFTAIVNFFTKEDLKRKIKKQQVTINTLEAKLDVLTHSNESYRKLVEKSLTIIDSLNGKQEDIVKEINKQIEEIEKRTEGKDDNTQPPPEDVNPRRVTFDELFIDYSVKPTKEQYAKLIKGCLTLGKFIHLNSIGAFTIDDKLTRKQAHKINSDAIKNIIMEFAHHDGIPFETAFQIITNSTKLRSYIQERLVYYSARLQLLVSDDALTAYYRIHHHLPDEYRHVHFDKLHHAFLAVYKEIRLALVDFETYLEQPSHYSHRWYPLDHLEQLCLIAEHKGDERWVNEDFVFNKTAFSEFVKNIQYINRYINTSGE